MISVKALVRAMLKRMVKEQVKPTVVTKTSEGWSACISFTNIPHSLLTVMTVTMMWDGEKKVYKPTPDFQEMMTILEKRLEESRKEYESTKSIHEDDRLDCSEGIVFDETPYDLFEPTWKWMTKYKDWYSKLNVHRCFFIPKNSILITLKHLLVHELLGGFWTKGIKQVSIKLPELPNGLVPAANRISGELHINTYEYRPTPAK